MEIIGDAKRLIGCNMKVVRSNMFLNYAENRIGEIYEILGKPQKDDVFIFDNSEKYIEKRFNFNEVKILLDDAFLEKFKSENIVVNCTTQEEVMEFCKWMHSNNMKWSDGISYEDMTSWDIYKESICYTGVGGCCDKYFYEREGYTILKFSDCILPGSEHHDFLETESFNEFVEYWKKNDVYIKFDTIEEKEKFIVEGLSSSLLDEYTLSYSHVYWDYTCWNAMTEKYKNDGYKIINYKNLKDWREILNYNKFNIGDEVIVVNSGKSYRNYSDMATHLKATNFVCGSVIEGYTVGKVINYDSHLTSPDGDGILYLIRSNGQDYIISEDGIELNNKEVKEIKGMRYKVTKPFTLNEILKNHPCEEEFDNLVEELSTKYSYKEIVKGDIEFTEDNWRDYDTLTEPENVEWLCDVELIKEKEEEFVPFTIEVRTKDEALNLLWRLNSNSVDEPCPHTSAKRPDNEDVFGLYSRVAEKCRERSIIK